MSDVTTRSGLPAEQELMSSPSAGIDVDIDVEHEGQKTKVTPPTQSGAEPGDVEMNEEGGASNEDGVNQGSKVSQQLYHLWNQSGINVCLIRTPGCR